MAYPIIELIARNIEETLRGVQTEGAYNNRLKVQRYNRHGNTIEDSAAIIIQDEPDLVDDGAATGTMEWNQPFAIVLYAAQSEAVDETMSIDQRLNLMRSDVEKALVANHTSRTRGGYAMDTRLQAPNRGDTENGLDAVIVNVTVNYRTDTTDPYTQR